MKFEYKTIVFPLETKFLMATGEIDEESFTDELNKAGKEGWEMINALDLNLNAGGSKNIVAIFKRQVN
jgi:hypothetical protein